MVQVSGTVYPSIFVRDDGWVSRTGKNGPWTRGVKVCVNSDLVRSKGRTPKYYFAVHYFDTFLYVHRLVALAFCENPNPAEFRLVDHISGASLANESSNLRWLNHQLNCMNIRGTRNCFHMKKPNRWRASVKVNGKSFRWGWFKTFRQAHLAAQRFKEAEFTKIYRSFITNETPTTSTCQYLFGRPGPIVFESEVPVPGVRWSGVLQPTEHRLHSQLPTPCATTEEKEFVPVSLKENKSYKQTTT